MNSIMEGAITSIVTDFENKKNSKMYFLRICLKFGYEQTIVDTYEKLDKIRKEIK